jgi:hypothetical protein
MGRKTINIGMTDEELLNLAKTNTALDIAKHISIAHKVDVSERTIQRRLHALRSSEESMSEVRAGAAAGKEDLRPLAGGSITAPDKLRTKLAGTRFVFTSAQNNTHVHEGFFKSLMNFCNEKKAELLISPFAYNKSGFQNGTKDDDSLWYDPKIVPYFFKESAQVARGLIFCGELDILPTAVNPLSGFENYTQNNSGIIPHAKVQMQSLPRMKGEDARFLYTTGAITMRNYIQRKAGQKAGFHHVFGALYVEIDAAGDWFVRQLVAAEDGSFYDLTQKFSPDGVEDSRVAAITWGDIHLEKLDYQVWEGAWGMNNDSMLNALNPEIQFVHDLTDFKARNHHNLDDPFFLAEMHHRGSGNVEKDLLRCGSFLQHITRHGNPAVVVESNHDQALERWLKTADIRRDPENAEFFHRAQAFIHRSIRLNEPYHIFRWAVTRGGEIATGARFLKEDESVLVHGIEHGMHGHRGPNGSRGNPRGFRTVGRKVNIGHMHSAGIFDGVYVAGVSGMLDMDYNKGPSSWSHSHIVTYPNGKRTIVTMRNGKWRAK